MSLKTGRKGKYKGGSFASRFKTSLAMSSPLSVVVAGEQDELPTSDAAAAKAEIDAQSQSPKDEIPTDTDYSREEVGAFFQRKKLAEEQEAAKKAAEDAAKVAQEAGLRKVKVFVKGPGNGRESAIRTLHNGGIEVTEIVDVTPMPHNGCRPPKRRRV